MNQQPRQRVRWWILLLALAVVAVASQWALSRLQIDSDIFNSVPMEDPVLASAKKMLARHPALDQIAIDLSFADQGIREDRLVAAARWLKAELVRSDLFDRVGMDDLFQEGPALLSNLAANLPFLFSSAQLPQQIEPRLFPESIRESLQNAKRELADLAGIGQAELMARDPLGFRNLVLARLVSLNPAPGSRFYNGQILSADGKHLLLLVQPKGSSSDTNFSQRLNALFQQLQKDINPALQQERSPMVLTPVGGYRAALDNENIIKQDTQLAVVISTIGIALLLLMCFPRPWLGLLALIPALGGVSIGLLVYSLFYSKISALALGFGGALVSMTVDCPSAFLLVLDRNAESTGRGASREVFASGFFSTLTYVAAFLSLQLSGFPVLGELGLFAALGMGFSFLFVHTVLRWTFRRVNAIRRRSFFPVESLLNRLGRVRSLAGVFFAVVVVIVLLIKGWPDAMSDITAMNTVSPETKLAEKTIGDVWGNVFQRTYLMIDAPDPQQMMKESDQLAALFENEKHRLGLTSAFCPSLVAPGPRRAAENLAAWKQFFTPQRIDSLRGHLARLGAEAGFSADAFEPFLESLLHPNEIPEPASEAFLQMLGMTRAKDGQGWIWMGAVEPGPTYQAEEFHQLVNQAGVDVFDSTLFGVHLSALLSSMFSRLFVVVGLAVLILVVLLFLDLWLVLCSLLPLALAMLASLGALKWIGHPLDIPSLMLSVMVLGMGVEYSLFVTCAMRRHRDANHPLVAPVRVAAFLAAATTLMGMLSLIFANHAVLKSAGVSSFLGIGFALIGAFVLLPPLLNRLFVSPPFSSEMVQVGSQRHRRLVQRRFRHMEPYARWYAYFKIRLDPMFATLEKRIGEAKSLLDIGCGPGVCGSWLVTCRPSLRYFGFDPNPEKVRVARIALGERGQIDVGQAPVFPDTPMVDHALLLDVAQYLSDDELAATFTKVGQRFLPQGKLILRAIIPDDAKNPWPRRMEHFLGRIKGAPPRFRSLDQLTALLQAQGYQVDEVEPCALSREETWITASLKVKSITPTLGSTA